ncbi:LADA_0D01354g1_1 [Lachancea dasiensis]|uniref:CAAX prenyl protease n=1 Tax=Lachancea dasiensis TaxID=1072105 RepID=A0A1G4J449_9SACH|nr:LADA_0D01354g1_1 [Lachancea dasiensis]
MSFVDSIQAFFDNSNIPWKAVITAFTLGQFGFETYLSYRQYRTLASKKLPEVLEGAVDAETFQKSEDYSRSKMKFNMFSSVFSLVQNLCVIKLDLLPRLWHLGVAVANKLPSKLIATSTIGQSLWFFTVLSNISTILELPLSYYQHFVLEEKYGFNKLTVGLWITDKVKGSLLSAVIGMPVMYAFLKIFEAFPTNFLAYICGFILVVQILAMTLIPVYIMPLFNKFTPLEDGELKTSIHALAKRVNFPLDKIFVVDGSKRSSHSNAYFTGLPFTSKRIVLYDTLVKDASVDEITAVLAHEIGHWQENHILRMLAFSEIHIGFIFSLFTAAYQNQSLYSAFGFFVGNGASPSRAVVVTPQLPVLIGFMLFNDLLQPLECGMNFGVNLLSRFHEYQADAYAKKLGYRKDLCHALINLQVKNLSTMNVDPIFSSYHYSHPTLPERLNALDYVSEQKKD